MTTTAKRTSHIFIFNDEKKKFWTTEWEFDNNANGDIQPFFWVCLLQKNSFMFYNVKICFIISPVHQLRENVAVLSLQVQATVSVFSLFSSFLNEVRVQVAFKIGLNLSRVFRAFTKHKAQTKKKVKLSVSWQHHATNDYYNVRIYSQKTKY